MSLLGLIIAVVSLDLWSKWAIKSSLRLYQSKPIIEDFFHLTYVTNDGMAFGLSLPGGQVTLTILSVFMTLVLGYFFYLSYQKQEEIFTNNSVNEDKIRKIFVTLRSLQSYRESSHYLKSRMERLRSKP